MPSPNEMAGAGITGVATSVGWLAQANEWLLFVSTIIAILVGLATLASFACKWIRRNRK